MKDVHQHITEVSAESLEVFENIASKARKKLESSSGDAAGSLASVNVFTDGGAVNRLDSISSSTRESYRALMTEPAISRVVAMDEKGQSSTFYISRKSTVPLGGDAKLASYQSQIGRLAALPIGDDATISISGTDVSYEVIEKAIYRPILRDGAWDSRLTVFEGVEFETLTVASLLALLQESGIEDAEEALESLLGGADKASIKQGLQHDVREAMALRDQPILDRFQDEIFRLPINSQLLIIGPPGTGKTTTLIRRLGQKISNEYLETAEKAIVERTESRANPHRHSWIMFTPTDLLKHYVKEAFNREHVPASDEHIKNWDSHRNDLSRRVLGILQSASTKGKFVLKSQLEILDREVEKDPTQWFDGFSEFHRSRILTRIQNGVENLESLQDTSNLHLIESISKSMKSADMFNLISLYRELNNVEGEVSLYVDSLKSESDSEIRKCLLRTFNADREFLSSLAEFLDEINTDEEPETDDEFEDDNDGEEPSPDATSSQKAERVYSQTLRSLARANFTKRKIKKSSRAGRVAEWLGDRVPSESRLHTIGQSIVTQAGFRRFVNPSRRLVADVPASYREYRRHSSGQNKWYTSMPENRRHIDAMELDAIVLLMLQSARELMLQNFVSRNLDKKNYSLLNLIAQQFRNQILVDEATDFSPIQLACMSSLTYMGVDSFFACGDFNQRITTWGTRSEAQFRWAVNRIGVRSINTVYRQSQKLNEFSRGLLKTLGGDVESGGSLPKKLNHVGVSPVLREKCDSIAATAVWLAKRIQEVERAVNIGKMPTTAILVNSEEEVRPMVDALNERLEDVNLRAVACTDGQSLGEGTDVRVFDVQHIKGLEFEAVFFAGLDRLARDLPELFDKYLYVGATRAATYFGVTCNDKLPTSLESLKDHFIESWDRN